MTLLAVGEIDLQGWLQVVVQLGAAGVVLWYFGHKLVPALLASKDEARDLFLAALASERAANDERTKRTHERIDELTRAVNVLNALVRERHV